MPKKEVTSAPSGGAIVGQSDGRLAVRDDYQDHSEEAVDQMIEERRNPCYLDEG